jgi:hypothetical protein
VSNIKDLVMVSPSEKSARKPPVATPMASDESRSHPTPSIVGEIVQHSEFLNRRKKFIASTIAKGSNRGSERRARDHFAVVNFSGDPALTARTGISSAQKTTPSLGLSSLVMGGCDEVAFVPAHRRVGSLGAGRCGTRRR